jgi:microfibrillar-associated protein 1
VRGKREPAGSEDESTASEEEEDEDDIARRRAAARARLAARRAEEEEGMPVGEEDDDEDFPADAKPRPPKPVASEDEGSSSWETDTDASDSDDDARKMVRPVFVSRAQRETLRARDDETNEETADDEWAAAEAHKKKRAEESRRLVELEIERETAIANAETNAEASDVDTDDDVEDPAVAYAAWRLRELARIEEDEKTRDRMFAEREEQEKIRRMSEEEKRAYFAAHPELRRETELGGSSSANGKDTSKDKPKLGFMQKYYHKGAFFQEAADDAVRHGFDARDLRARFLGRHRRRQGRGQELSAEGDAGARRQVRQGGSDQVDAPRERGHQPPWRRSARSTGKRGRSRASTSRRRGGRDEDILYLISITIDRVRRAASSTKLHVY